MSEETYGQDATGLREAALEVSKARESSQGGTENVSLVAEDHHKPEEPAADPTLTGKDGLTVRQAAAERPAEVRKRLEGDEEFARAMGEHVPSPENSGEIDGLHNASINQLVDAKENYDAEVARLRELNDSMEKRASDLEAEVRRTNANAAYREAQLAQVAQQATGSQLEQFRQAKLAEFLGEYPETMTEQGLGQLAKENPHRYAEATKAWERANNDYLAARYQVEVQEGAVAQQQRAAFNTYAAQQDAAFERAHPEFAGEAGKRALTRLAEATVAELTEEYGVSREQIAHLYNNDPNFRSHPVQEAAISLGRDRLNRQAIEEKRFRLPLPRSKARLCRHGAEGLRAEDGATQSRPVRAAAKLLTERRRSGR